MNGNQGRRLQKSLLVGVYLTAAAAALVSGCQSAGTATDGWRSVAPGVDYRHYVDASAGSWHVTRIEVGHPEVRIFGSDETDRGRTVSDFARTHGAVAAINGDYFDADLAPVGPSRGYCGDWHVRAAPVSRRQPNFVAGSGRAAIVDAERPIPDWADVVVSGWPLVVTGCRAIPSAELPGSDFFTRAPHMRTAVGFSEDGQTLFLVVADRIEDGEFGVTLPELGTFMHETLGVCEGLNLDGGGSSALTIDEILVSRPKSGRERNVANHIGVTVGRSAPACEDGTAASRVDWSEVASLGLEGSESPSGTRYALPWDEGSILLAELGPEVMMSGSLVTTREVARSMEQQLDGSLRVSWTTPLEDGRVRVQLGGRTAPEALQSELRALLTFAPGR